MYMHVCFCRVSSVVLYWHLLLFFFSCLTLPHPLRHPPMPTCASTSKAGKLLNAPPIHIANMVRINARECDLCMAVYVYIYMYTSTNRSTLLQVYRRIYIYIYVDCYRDSICAYVHITGCFGFYIMCISIYNLLFEILHCMALFEAAPNSARCLALAMSITLTILSTALAFVRQARQGRVAKKLRGRGRGRG